MNSELFSIAFRDFPENSTSFFLDVFVRMFDSLQQIILGRWQRFKTEGLCYGHCDNKISEDVLWNKIIIKVQTNFTVFFYVQITRENGSILVYPFKLPLFHCVFLDFMFSTEFHAPDLILFNV